MLKLRSQVIKKGPAEQIRIEQQGTGTDSYLDCRIWQKSEDGKWEPTDRECPIPLRNVVEAYDQCEQLVRNGKHKRHRQEPGFQERVTMANDALTRQNEILRQHMIDAITLLLKEPCAC